MISTVPMPGMRAGYGRLIRPSRLLISRSCRGFSSTSAARHDRPGPFRMAVIGSGPAGFYTAYRAMSLIDGAKVDMYEALPVPFGLVRYGVAPDHPEVKNCQEKFEEVASSPDFTFLGNLSVGVPAAHRHGLSVQLASILRNYDAVVFAYGASRDKTLGIPGEDSLRGIYSAREFVGWYNGLPEFAGLAPDLSSAEEAVIIGQGNVALDVARILLEDVDVLRKSDITEYALEELSRSKIKRVHVVGRRGPVQAAFTTKEVRELMGLSGVTFHPIDTSLLPETPELVKKLPRSSRRMAELLLKGSKTSVDEASKSWSLDFCASPASFNAEGDESKVATTTFERTSLSSILDPQAQATGTGERMHIPSQVVFRSIGYKSEPLPEFTDAGIVFDERRGVIRNDGLGRITRDVRNQDGSMSQEPNPGLYCAGWVKRGPTGVIASTMTDAFITADAIAHDWKSKGALLSSQQSQPSPGWEGVLGEKGALDAEVVRWEDWQRIDKAERERGQARNKAREKFATTSEMLGVLSNSRDSTLT